MSQRILVKSSQNHNKFNSISKITRSLALVMGLFLITAFSAAASEEVQYDDVFFNDYKLGFIEQMALEDHIDRDIPDGKYWFELETGMWGPVGGTAIGRIEIPDDYQDYVKTRLFKEDPATQVELTAAADLIALQDDLNYVKSIHPKQSPATQVELTASNDNQDYAKSERSTQSSATQVELTASVEKCDNRCLRIFIEQLVSAFSIPGERKSFLSF